MQGPPPLPAGLPGASNQNTGRGTQSFPALASCFSPNLLNIISWPQADPRLPPAAWAKPPSALASSLKKSSLLTGLGGLTPSSRGPQGIIPPPWPVKSLPVIPLPRPLSHSGLCHSWPRGFAQSPRSGLPGTAACSTSYRSCGDLPFPARLFFMVARYT